MIGFLISRGPKGPAPSLICAFDVPVLQSKKGAKLTFDPLKFCLAETLRLGANCLGAGVACCCNNAAGDRSDCETGNDIAVRANAAAFAAAGRAILRCRKRLRRCACRRSDRKDRRWLKRNVATLHRDLCRRTAGDNPIANEERLTSACWKKLAVTCHNSTLRGCGQRADGLLGSRKQRCRKARHHNGGGYPRKFHFSLP